MHVPDGFLDAKTIVATTALSAVGVGAAWSYTRAHMPARRVPLMGVAAAFVFAAQMLNFPVAGGTSGHLMGAVLIAILLGPSASVIVLTSIMVVQCFLFADGGILSLGANVFNMAIVGTFSGYAVYTLISRILPGPRGSVIAVAIASWCSVVLASICCAGELAWTGTVPWAAAFPAMAGVHMLIGLGEGLITSLVIAAIRKARPELLMSTAPPLQQRRYGQLIVYSVVVTIGLVLFVTPFASPWPDGLASVAARFGFDQRALQTPIIPTLFTGYMFPGLGVSTAARILGGTAGVLIILGLVVLLMKIRPPRNKAAGESDLPQLR